MYSKQFLARIIFVLLFAASFAQTGNAQDSGDIQGVVYNAAGDLALDAQVRLIGMGQVTTVNEVGAFEFSSLPAGRYVLEAISVRWGRGLLEVTVQDAQTSEVTLEAILHADLEELVISAGPMTLTRSSAVQVADALSYQDLADAAETTLGETLGQQPGISSSYFGPGSARPIIRGVGGSRVGILQEGLTVGDVSDVNPDHASGVEPLLADRVEIIRGPATLLYGSSAIGGVVNMQEGRVPTERPVRAFSGTLTGRVSSVSQGRTGALKLRGRGGNLVWSVSGLMRGTGDFSVPAGSIVEEEHDEDHDEDHEDGDDHEDEDEHGELIDRIENSNLSLGRGSVGLSYVGDWGYIGAAFTMHGTNYGVPGHGHHEEEEGHDDEHDEHEEGEAEEEAEEEAAVRVDLAQPSINLAGQWRMGGDFLKGLRFRFGTTFYQHDEVEGDEVALTFENDLVEGRVEADHVLADGLSGVIGLQVDQRRLDVSGHEAIMPGSSTNRVSLFMLERLTRGKTNLEVGLRFERAAMTPDAGRDRTFSAFSVGGGVNVQASDQLSLVLGAARSVKIPHPVELYINGFHVGTQVIEIGNEDLSVESAFSIDMAAHVQTDRVDVSASLFSNTYHDFIYLRHTPDASEETPVYTFTQGSATFRGFEAETEVALLDRGHQRLALRLMSDYTHAHRTDADEPLPRIPPMRIGGGLSFHHGSLEVGASFHSAAEQDRVARFEEVTPGFVEIGANAKYRFFLGGTGHVVSLQGRNLTDATRRLHTSFLKDQIPLPGRDIRLTYRLLF